MMVLEVFLRGSPVLTILRTLVSPALCRAGWTLKSRPACIVLLLSKANLVFKCDWKRLWTLCIILGPVAVARYSMGVGGLLFENLWTNWSIQ